MESFEIVMYVVIASLILFVGLFIYYALIEDERVCIESHQGTILMPIYSKIGQTTIINYIPTQTDICDKYEGDL